MQENRGGPFMIGFGTLDLLNGQNLSSNCLCGFWRAYIPGIFLHIL